MYKQDAGYGDVGVGARTPRIEQEMAAARRLLKSKQSQIDEVLSAVADRLAKDIGPVSGLGALEERAPAAADPVPVT